MNLKKKLIGINSLLVIMLLLAACGPQTTPAPTLDANMLFTQAAQTVIAQLTKNAPTITPTHASTNTPQPSLTPLGGMLPTLPLLSTLAPMKTPTMMGYTGADKAAYVTQSPADYTNVKTGQVFNITWRLQNTGTTTWNTNYVYRFYSATNKIPTNANGINLPSVVPPKGFVDLTVVATAPSSVGTYDTQWVITNPEGSNFFNFTAVVNVIQGSSGGSVEATAVPIPGNPCEDTGTNSGKDLAIGVDNLDVSGGQMYVYYKLTSGTTAAVLKLGTPVDINDNHIEVSVLSTTEMVVAMGEPSKNGVKLFVEVTGAPVTITRIVYWKSDSSCF